MCLHETNKLGTGTGNNYHKTCHKNTRPNPVKEHGMCTALAIVLEHGNGFKFCLEKCRLVLNCEIIQ